MNTPEWYGSIGIMNSAHMSRRGLGVMLSRGIRALRYALATVGRRRSPARPHERRARGAASA